MEHIELPEPKIKHRPYNNQLYSTIIEQGLDPILARILSSREIGHLDLYKIIDPKLSNLKNPYGMQDLQLGAHRLAKAIINREYIGIETDHDCDGQTSHAIIYYNLVKHFKFPENLISSYIGHRLYDGYGLSENVVQKILTQDPKVSILITADNGSSDEPRVAKLRAAGIDVIITDHHQISEANYPYSAYAFINPTRPDCQYDPYIAGCMVAWLLMVATRIELINLNYLTNAAPKLLDTLDYVAVGTVADCVSFAKSHTNRAVVKFGLKLINAEIKTCWRVCKQHFKDLIATVDLGFKIGPLLNSDGRLSDAFGSVGFLLEENFTIALQQFEQLLLQNQTRKQIQKQITYQAVKLAKEQFNMHKRGICIYLDEGHPGIHGIIASKIKEYFGRPVVILSNKFNTTDLVTGSIRGIEGFNVKMALEDIFTNSSDLLLSYGGHEGAGGVNLLAKNINKFADLFETAVQKQLPQSLEPIIWTDGILPVDLINLSFVERLKSLEPYGRGFEDPIFHNQAILSKIQFIGDGTHARVELNIDGKICKGIWFSMKQDPAHICLLKPLDRVLCVFKLMENSFNNVVECQLQIITIIKMEQ